MRSRTTLTQLLERLVRAVERIAKALDSRAGQTEAPRKPRQVIRPAPTVEPTELDRARAAKIANKLGLKTD